MTAPNSNRRLVLMLLLLWTSIGGPLSAQRGESPPKGTLQFFALNNDGKPLPYKLAAFINTTTGRDYAPLASGLRLAGVPFGTYRYELVRVEMNAGRIDGSVMLSEPDQWLTVIGSDLVAVDETGSEITIDRGGRPGVGMRGTLTPVPGGDGPIWVKFQSVYQAYSVEAAVDSTGAFRIGQRLHGKYLLLVFQNGKLVGLEPIEFEHSRSTGPIVIRVRPNMATFIHAE